MKILERQSVQTIVEAGCDEAGRGCLAGPVFAAAVILPENFEPLHIDDSKLLKKKDRIYLRKYIEENSLDYCVARVCEDVIDEINILNASILAMHKALEGLRYNFDCIAVDGNRFKPFKDKPFKCVIKGDSKFLNIAAASILAKTYRDEYMEKIHEDFPAYLWNKNAGYGTLKHREAIQKWGATDHHRKSFRLLKVHSELDFS